MLTAFLKYISNYILFQKEMLKFLTVANMVSKLVSIEIKGAECIV